MPLVSYLINYLIGGKFVEPDIKSFSKYLFNLEEHKSLIFMCLWVFYYKTTFLMQEKIQIKGFIM